MLLVTFLLVKYPHLIRRPYLFWSNLSSTLKKHEKNPDNIARVERADDFLAIERGKEKDIECILYTNYNALVEKNRKILVGIVDKRNAVWPFHFVCNVMHVIHETLHH